MVTIEPASLRRTPLGLVGLGGALGEGWCGKPSGLLLMPPRAAGGRAGFPEPLLTLDCHKEEVKFTCSGSLFYKTDMPPPMVTLDSKNSSSEDQSIVDTKQMLLL